MIGLKLTLNVCLSGGEEEKNISSGLDGRIEHWWSRGIDTERDETNGLHKDIDLRINISYTLIQVKIWINNYIKEPKPNHMA
ncbi:hypothetical protein P8452_30979 [Trifolium repens]|nr:hypothetical protein P8452_30979 [Trifolium repens]